MYQSKLLFEFHFQHIFWSFQVSLRKNTEISRCATWQSHRGPTPRNSLHLFSCFAVVVWEFSITWIGGPAFLLYSRPENEEVTSGKTKIICKIKNIYLYCPFFIASLLIFKNYSFQNDVVLTSPDNFLMLFSFAFIKLYEGKISQWLSLSLQAALFQATWAWFSKKIVSMLQLLII